jgi:hypothetical protein
VKFFSVTRAQSVRIIPCRKPALRKMVDPARSIVRSDTPQILR